LNGGCRYVKNITDFVETIQLVNIVGRRAHDVRYNLWYDNTLRILYSSGHTVAILKLKRTGIEERQLVITNQIKSRQ
jgi:hypothetical protein